MSSAPPLSVIIVNHNGGARLSATLSSVWEQRGAQTQIIVIDRGSTDESARWLEAQRTRLARLILAERESHYGAANRGIAAADGEWLFLLQCGDRLVGDRILSECLNWMKKTEAGVVAGETATDDGRILKLRSHVNPLARNFVPPSSTFYRRTLFEENGAFDTSLESMAAYEYNLRLWKSRVRFKPIPLRVAACESRGDSKWSACKEEIRTRHRYFSAWRCWFWDALSMLRCAKPGRRKLT